MQIEKYTDRLKAVVQAAQTLALRSGHQQFTPLHIAKALLDDQDGLAANLIAACGGRPEQVRQAVDRELGKLPKVEGGGGQIYLAPETARLFDQAEQMAQKAGDSFRHGRVRAARPGAGERHAGRRHPQPEPASPPRPSTRPSPICARDARPRPPPPRRAMTRSRNTRAISPRKRARASSIR